MRAQLVWLHPRLTVDKAPRRGRCAFGSHFLSTLGLRILQTSFFKTLKKKPKHFACILQRNRERTQRALRACRRARVTGWTHVKVNMASAVAAMLQRGEPLHHPTATYSTDVGKPSGAFLTCAVSRSLQVNLSVMWDTPPTPHAAAPSQVMATTTRVARLAGHICCRHLLRPTSLWQQQY